MVCAHSLRALSIQADATRSWSATVGIVSRICLRASRRKRVMCLCIFIPARVVLNLSTALAATGSSHTVGGGAFSGVESKKLHSALPHVLSDLPLVFTHRVATGFCLASESAMVNPAS
jgi:hypothetical protein